MKASLLHPVRSRPETLARELAGFFYRFPYVARVQVFGSQGRGEWDRWSDVDLLLTTDRGPESYWEIFASLKADRRVVYHGEVKVDAEPAGGFVLGIVLQGESVFHKLDLNFISSDDVRQGENLTRFGPLRTLEARRGVPPPEALPDEIQRLMRSNEQDRTEERRIWEAMHPVYTEAKRVLRGGGSRPELEAARKTLAEELSRDDGHLSVPGGDIRSPARIWLEIADEVLRRYL